MDKITVYTCITGGYDNLTQPFTPAEGFDFICFVRRGTKTDEKIGVWKIVEIPFDWDDDRLLARSQKLNPHSALPEDCDWSLWIDGNIRIADDSIYRLCRELQAKDVRFAGIFHPYRDCVYQEAVVCLRNRRESLCKLLRVVTALRRSGVPEHAGLMETNVIFRRHNDPSVVEFDRWWWECLVKYTVRDQLTQIMALLDTPSLKVAYLFPKGVSSRNCSALEYVPHPAPSLNFLQRKLKFGPGRPEALILKAYINLSRYLVRARNNPGKC